MEIIRLKIQILELRAFRVVFFSHVFPTIYIFMDEKNTNGLFTRDIFHFVFTYSFSLMVKCSVAVAVVAAVAIVILCLRPVQKHMICRSPTFTSNFGSTYTFWRNSSNFTETSLVSSSLVCFTGKFVLFGTAPSRWLARFRHLGNADDRMVYGY